MKLGNFTLIALALLGSVPLQAQTPYTANAGTVLLYHFDESAGASVAVDSSGNGRNADYGNTVTTGAPSMPNMGNSMAVGTGSNATKWVDTTTPGQNSVLYTLGTQAFTFETWVKLDSTSFTGNRLIFAVGPTESGKYPDYFLSLIGSENVDFPLALSFGYTDSSDTYINYVFTIAPQLEWNTDTWYHIAVTLNPLGNGETEFKIYRNVAGDSTTPAPIWTQTRNDISLGSSTAERAISFGNAYGFDELPGQLDEVRLSTGALTEFTTLAVPEPSAYAFLSLGLGCAAIVALRRRHTVAMKQL